MPPLGLLGLVFARRLRAGVRLLFARFGYSLRQISRDEYRYLVASYDDSTALPKSAEEALRLDNPQLQALRKAYRVLDLPVTQHTVWDEKRLAEELTLPWFRGDNAYVWQFRQMGSEMRLRQYLVLRYVESRDALGLLNKLEEDGAFGCWTFKYGDRNPVSRDLLESVNEINFLDRQLGISNIEGLKLLDIGAGYGRLAHRTVEGLPNLTSYHCVDAVPESTFVCDYYLNYRGIAEKARSIPLHQLEQLSPPGDYHLAVNIYSFSECTREAVRWWLEKLRSLQVPYLLIVPNHPERFLTVEQDGSHLDFYQDIDDTGYELICNELVYNDEELCELIGVRTRFFLFRLRNEQ